MDCSGLIAYCVHKLFNKSIGGGCKQQWEYFTKSGHIGKILYCSSNHLVVKTGKDITSSQLKAGDLIYKFNYDGVGNHHALIATGSGAGIIDASGGTSIVREQSNYAWALKDVDLWVRLYEDGETYDSSAVGATTPSSDVVDTEGGTTTATSYYSYAYLLAGGLPLTNVDVYKDAMTSILSEISKSPSYVLNDSLLAGKSLGYITDLTHGGYLKFILPENYTEAYSASYETISIPGRSSDVLSYNSTPSPTRAVNITLMAGEGLYKMSSPVEAMQKDIAFLKSLVYPDYTSAIVRPPAIVLLYLGPCSIIKGVVSEISVNYKKPYTVDGKPMRAEISFTVVQASDDPADYKDVQDRDPVTH
jgi:hypothetical protein